MAYILQVWFSSELLISFNLLIALVQIVSMTFEIMHQIAYRYNGYGKFFEVLVLSLFLRDVCRVLDN